MSGHEVDLTGAKQQFWLVKVPKYLEEQWQKVTDGGEIGEIHISKGEGPAEASFFLKKELSLVQGVGSHTAHVPSEHKLVTQTLTGQTIAVFSESSSGKISLEGQVGKRVRFRPKDIKQYAKLKKLPRTEPGRLAESLGLRDHPGPRFKPVASHPEHQEDRMRRKEEGRMVKEKTDLVLDMLFFAFEKKDNYSVKELMDITKQPVAHLKKHLKKVALYNVDGSSKHTWQLKPEYKFYSVDKKNNK